MVSDTVGYGAIILALISLLTKVWMDSAKSVDRMLSAFEENAKASTKLSTAIDSNTRVTEETKIAAYEHNKNITVLISKVVGRRK